MAIDYIKALKMTLEQTTTKLAAAEAKLAGPSDTSAPTAAATTTTSATTAEPSTNGTSPDETKGSS